MIAEAAEAADTACSFCVDSGMEWTATWLDGIETMHRVSSRLIQDRKNFWGLGIRQR